MKKNLVIIFIVLCGLAVATYVLFIIRKASNEVLESFGTLNEKFEDINTDNQAKMDSIQNIIMYSEFTDKFEALDRLNQDFNYYIEHVKNQLLVNVEDPTDYSKMEEINTGNTFFFDTEGYTPKGQDFVNHVETYKKDVKHLFSDVSIDINKDVNELFNNHVQVEDWLDYNFRDFPLIATVTKLTSMSFDIDNLKREILNKVLSQ